MTDSLTLIDMFVRGIAVAAMGVTGLSFLASGPTRDVRIAVSLASLSICCWLITESHPLWAAFGLSQLLLLPAMPVAALFWLFVVTVFADRPLTLLTWTPAIILLVSGIICDLVLPPHSRSWLWAARNVFSALLSLHAALVIAWGWAGDLLEVRRRMRALVLGFGAVFAVSNTVIALAVAVRPNPALEMWMAGKPYGGAVFSVLMVAGAAVFLQARPGVVGGVRRTGPQADPRAAAAERLMLDRLTALMAADGWRQEGLTIGEVARRLDAPEHRVRRLINQRLGHRNFADYVNSFRISAAKARLADPGDARTTVAAIAFDLGYGSLGPFNRAFREATGVTPTAWRRQALSETSLKLREAV